MAILCIIALIVFAIMGIFSAKYRAYAKEAFNCFVNTMRLRKCDTGLDEKIKAEVVSRVLAVSPSAARTVNTNFELISTVFVVLMLASSVYSVWSLYNFFIYGNCNGQEGGYCILSDLAGKGGVAGTPLFPANKDGQAFGSTNYKLAVYEYGCYSCPYTAAAEPVVQRLFAEYGNRVEFIYKTYPIPQHPYSHEAATASWCAYEEGQAKYMKYRESLFSNQDSWRAGGNSTLLALASSSGLDMAQFNSCFASGKYDAEVDKLSAEGKSLGIYGTPTFFIGNQTFVGAVTYDQLKSAVEMGLNN